MSTSTNGDWHEHTVTAQSCLTQGRRRRDRGSPLVPYPHRRGRLDGGSQPQPRMTDTLRDCPSDCSSTKADVVAANCQDMEDMEDSRGDESAALAEESQACPNPHTHTGRAGRETRIWSVKRSREDLLPNQKCKRGEGDGMGIGHVVYWGFDHDGIKLSRCGTHKKRDTLAKQPMELRYKLRQNLADPIEHKHNDKAWQQKEDWQDPCNPLFLDQPS